MAEGADASGLPVSDVDLLRRRIVNVVGHELRTPTTTVRGLAEAVAAAGGGHEQDELVAALVHSSRRLERLVEDLLLASAVTTVVPTGAPSELDLGSLVADAWEEVGGDGELVVEGVANARGRRRSVQRALVAVLDNAAHLGDGPVAVSLGAHEDGVALRVSSAGPVLKPEELALASEAFFRGEAAVTRRPGLGLGLAVALALVEGEGGTLSVAGREGGGVVTTITLPAP